VNRLAKKAEKEREMARSPEVRIGELLRERHWRLATAESCTGGLVSHLVTNVPGSSDYFVGGVVAYSNPIKERLLGVPREQLVEHGAVSEEVAISMAEGARRELGAEVGLSVTGIAGPGGGTPSKPVGLTWVAVATPGGTRAQVYAWQGKREENKRESALAALWQAVRWLEGGA
jgi:PncC family amidohydrolase